MPAANWVGCTANETLEERLVLEVFVVLLEMLLGRGHELDSDELIPANYQ